MQDESLQIWDEPTLEECVQAALEAGRLGLLPLRTLWQIIHGYVLNSLGPEYVREGSVRMDKRLRVLLFAANPKGTKQLRLDEECREIQQKIRESAGRDLIEVIPCWAVRPRDILQAMNEHEPHIVQFSGHGATSGVALEDLTGRVRIVSKQALVQLFRTMKDRVELVVLNYCDSAGQAQAIANIAGYAIGMSASVGDEAAIVFASSLYQAIAYGRSIEEAFDQGITAIMLEGIPEEQTPRLFVRDHQASPRVLVMRGGRRG